jgi:hypothetical protein
MEKRSGLSIEISLERASAIRVVFFGAILVTTTLEFK